MNEQILIGALIVCLCGLGLWHERWLLLRTRNGRRLIDWFGRKRGRWVLRGLLVAGVLFGALLAANVIRPVEW